jgi:hypothetical protein
MLFDQAICAFRKLANFVDLFEERFSEKHEIFEYLW